MNHVDATEDRGTGRPIPREEALRLCAEIRRENRGRWYTFNGLWCWGCATFTGCEATKMCWHSPPNYRGCSQVNARHERQMGHPL